MAPHRHIVKPETGFATISGLTVADGAGTLALLALGGQEANPLLVPVIETVGPVWAMAWRVIAGVAGAGALAWLVGHPRSRWGSWPLTVAIVALGLVVASHAVQLGLWHVLA
jgi:hypothetical protein